MSNRYVQMSGSVLSKSATWMIVSITMAVVALTVIVILIVMLLTTNKKVVATSSTQVEEQSKYILGSFSYYNSAFPTPWTASDFTVTMTNGSVVPWQNIMITDGYASWYYYASVWTEIYNRTGVKITVFWNGNNIHLPNALDTFDSNYKQLLTVYPDLPQVPSGIFLYDEPNENLIFGQQANTTSMVNLTIAFKAKYPSALQYANFRYDSISGRNDICVEIGKSMLDYVSSDQYYDISIPTYQYAYKTFLYPNLKPNQKVLLVPFAAYYEISTPNTQITASVADSTTLYGSNASALKYYNWMQSDPRIYGLVIYRLKNLWWTPNGDILSNPNGTGLGLVDKDSGGNYVTPLTLSFYQGLGLSLYKSGTSL